MSIDELDTYQNQSQAAEIEEQEQIDNLTATSDEPQTTGSKTEQKVRNYFSDIPVMAEVARCESTFRQVDTDTGQPLRGRVNSYDVGVMQINELYHLNRAEELGYNIYTLKGNLGFARHLYERQGTQPWTASQPCWGNSGQLAYQK